MDENNNNGHLESQRWLTGNGLDTIFVVFSFTIIEFAL